MSKLQFSPDILKRLGEELVPHADQGLIELAKNAYDADATECTIHLKNVHAPGGKITISDNGLGMSRSSIENGWLVLGKSRKAGEHTNRYRRIPVGDKGLGRLAALRLGRKAILRTRPEEEPGVEHSVTLDWDSYDQALFVEEVPTPIKTKKTKKKPGTEIELQDLVKELSSTDIQRLSRSLVLLSDPFGGEQSFNARLSASEYEDFERLVKNAYFDYASYKLSARLLPNGKAEFEAFDWKNTSLWKEQSTKTYNAPEADFDLWIFILNSATFSSWDVTVKEVKSWLDVTGGVHIYEHGMRVAPYGGADSDWLKMNEMRAKSPEERPSTNTAIGQVRIKDNNDLLIQKTDRVGYIEDDTFQELRNFGQDALNWLARHRLKLAEVKRQSRKTKVEKNRQAKMRSLDNTLKDLPADEQSQKKIKDAVQKVTDAADQVADVLKNDLQLYRSLATAGISSAVFAHQITHPIRHIEDLLMVLENKLPPKVAKTLSTPLSHVRKAKDKLLAYARLPLKLLKAEKRRFGAIDFVSTLEEMLHEYEPILNHANISLDNRLPKSTIKIMGSAALIEGVFSNLLSNSIKAFERGGMASRDRIIRIDGRVEDEMLTVSFMDSGPGFADIPLEEIWLPGRTTDKDDRGTGFGLTIVRDSIKDLGGEVSSSADCNLGGAEFIVTLPVV